MLYNIYNWKRDYHNARDVYVHNHSGFKLTNTVPSSVDLRDKCSPVFDQGQLGSCTGNALVGALEYLENKDKDFENNGMFAHLSRLFVYYNERVIENDVYQDGGAQISDGIQTLSTVGACTEELWPYAVRKFKQKPTPYAYNDAATRKITAYARVSRDNGVDQIKQVLASGYPIVFGFSVYESFESDQVAQTGQVPMPSDSEQCQGGHAVMMVGYDDSTKRVLVRNSWGPNWGMNGYFTLPYEYVSDNDLANDFWTITK